MGATYFELSQMKKHVQVYCCGSAHSGTPSGKRPRFGNSLRFHAEHRIRVQAATALFVSGTKPFMYSAILLAMAAAAFAVSVRTTVD